MKLHKLYRKQWLDVSISKAWDFFSNPANLSSITPKEMGFVVKSELPEKVYQGLIISYIVKPIFNIPVTWVTEIKAVNEPFFFIDEQRFGPYKFWHHQHLFKEKNGGIEMEDIVHYVLPFGILGQLIQPILVEPKLNNIFNFRNNFLKDYKF